MKCTDEVASASLLFLIIFCTANIFWTKVSNKSVLQISTVAQKHNCSLLHVLKENKQKKSNSLFLGLRY